ncbi:MAG: ABC transporter ATP-binding protein [Sedimentisphaerales bacterium]|nr:ABC transporter ATP-binding protein [Sedimentisphaerales bacterium]
MTALLNIKNLNKHFDGVMALDDFSCTLGEGEILGVIGPNGAGKTTLFNVLTGFIPPDNGHVFLHGSNLSRLSPHKRARLGIGRTFQNLRLIRRISVLENVLLCFKDQPGERLSNVFFRRGKWRVQEARNRDKALSLLQHVGLADKANDPADALSYGQQKLLSIVCCLAADAHVLLLDEPVAGIAPEMIEKILGVIQDLPKQGKSVMLIEHNLDAVMQVCGRVVFMDAGAKISEGTPQQVRDDPRVIEAYID